MAREHRHEVQHPLLRAAERVERCSRRLHVAYELVVLPLGRGHHAALQPVEAVTDTVPCAGEYRIWYERRVAFADGGRELVGRALERLAPETHATVAQVADLPDVIRGYEDIKLRNVERFREEAARLEAELGSRSS